MAAMQQFQLNKEKLKEAVLLIASHCPTAELGNVKLHKILYFADMLSYLQDGQPITGVEYIKQKFGPVARHLTAAIADLSAEGRLTVNETSQFGFFKKNYETCQPFQKRWLADSEVLIIKEVADFIRGVSAREISELSHNAAWDIAEMGEVLPYFTALQILPVEITDSDMTWALESAKQYANSAPV